MAVPIDAIRAIHNAFRKDIALIDNAARAAAQGSGDLAPVVERYAFFNEVLVWHADGEEDAVFPALEGVAPLVAEAYEQDHRGLDRLFDSLDKVIKAKDALDTARAAATFNFFLVHHLDKEESHLYRVVEERIPLPEQGAIVGKMAQKVHAERMPEVVAWMFPLLGHDDRENMTRIWQQAMPAPVFAGATKLIQAAIGDDWADLTRRIPEIA